MNTAARTHRCGGGRFNMNLEQRRNNASRPQQQQQRKRKANPSKPPAPKRQKANNGSSIPRPQKFAAAAYATGQHTGEAKVFRSGNDTCRIVHRELLSSITGSINFTIQRAIALNPGLAASFPWLSTQAQAWERYRFNKLKFRYFTRTGSNIPGSLMMSPDYDAADPAPLGEAIASSYQDCEEDAPWKDITCTLPQRTLMGDMKEKTIRTGALAANQDVKTYDAGNLFVITTDGADNTTGWGKLWVEYDVTLFHPQVPAGGFQSSGTLEGGTNCSSADPFGLDSAQTATGPIQLSSPGTSQTLNMSGLQVGQEILLTVVITGTVVTAITVTTPTGLTLKTSLTNLVSATGTVATSNSTYLVTASSASVLVTSTATTITGTRAVVAALAPAPNF